METAWKHLQYMLPSLYPGWNKQLPYPAHKSVPVHAALTVHQEKAHLLYFLKKIRYHFLKTCITLIQTNIFVTEPHSNTLSKSAGIFLFLVRVTKTILINNTFSVKHCRFHAGHGFLNFPYEAFYFTPDVILHCFLLIRSAL